MNLRTFLYRNRTFTQLKRRIYLVILPVSVIAFTTVFISLYLSRGYLSFINIFTFSILCFGLTLCFVVLLFNKKSQIYIEITFTIFTAFIFLLRIYQDITSLGQNGQSYLGTVTFWVPILFLVFYFTFRGKVALTFSIIVYLISFFPGVYHLLCSPYVSGDTFDVLLQFYAATLAYIIALYFVQYIFEVFLQADLAKHLANTDSLTGLLNRRKLEEILDNEIETARSTGLPLSIILFDIDNFKQINDAFGHDTGDYALKEISLLAKNYLHEQTHIGRWGGEEFLILIPGKNIDAGRKLAETLRQLIESQKFSKVNQITSSFGVSEFIETDFKESILKRADEALYLAKNNGKNQVRLG